MITKEGILNYKQSNPVKFASKFGEVNLELLPEGSYDSVAHALFVIKQNTAHEPVLNGVTTENVEPAKPTEEELIDAEVNEKVEGATVAAIEPQE